MWLVRRDQILDRKWRPQDVLVNGMWYKRDSKGDYKVFDLSDWKDRRASY